MKNFINNFFGFFNRQEEQDDSGISAYRRAIYEQFSNLSIDDKTINSLGCFSVVSLESLYKEGKFNEELLDTPLNSTYILKLIELMNSEEDRQLLKSCLTHDRTLTIKGLLLAYEVLWQKVKEAERLENEVKERKIAFESKKNDKKASDLLKNL